MRASARNADYDFYRCLYLPSNGAIMHVVLCDRDLHFQGESFLNVSISEAMLGNIKMRAMPFIEVDIG